MKRYLKAIARKVKAVLTTKERAYQARVEAEQSAFNELTHIHDLPPIFQYWCNKYLDPKLNKFGITEPEQFFYLYVQKYLERFPGKNVKIASLGSGNCDMEARLARNLVDNNMASFTIDCMDINEVLLQRGIEHARNLHVEKHVFVEQGDFNNWQPKKTYDIVIANQCLHHVMELEILFERTKGALVAEGVFLVSDMIGRNGHQRWPEALKIVEEFWKELPEKYQYNQAMHRLELQYINHDCSTEGFEGIRAQDILPLLTKNFYFELFIPFANVVFAFIDRPFGHNFDATATWDKDYIDRVHARDEEGMLSGELTPTQMLAVLTRSPVTPQLLHPTLTPEFCIRDPHKGVAQRH